MARRCAIMAATGPAVLFVPSLINPPNVLDMGERSLLRWLAARGRRVLLLDWGWPGPDRRDAVGRRPCRADPAAADGGLGEPADLVGYCLGGTMALAAAQLGPARSVATLAAPWHFAGFPDECARRSRPALGGRAADGGGARPAADGGAAMRLLEPRPGPHHRQVRGLRRRSRAREARTFVMLEDWANDGPPLSEAAAREMFEGLFGDDRPAPAAGGSAARSIDPAVACPSRCSTSSRPPTASSRPPPRVRAGERLDLALGHVGMVVGREARETLWEPLAGWLSRTAASC